MIQGRWTAENELEGNVTQMSYPLNCFVKVVLILLLSFQNLSVLPHLRTFFPLMSCCDLFWILVNNILEKYLFSSWIRKTRTIIKYYSCVIELERLMQGNDRLLMVRHWKHLFIQLGMPVMLLFFNLSYTYSRKPGLSSRVIVQILRFWTLSIVLSSSETPSCLFSKTQRFVDWILSPSSGKTYSVGSNR
jgi:hypothetical protein